MIYLWNSAAVLLTVDRRLDMSCSVSIHFYVIFVYIADAMMLSENCMGKMFTF